MYARVSQYRVKPGLYDDFVDTLEAVIPLMRQQKGFRALLVLRVEGTNPPDVRVMTIWESQIALQQSESNVFFYQAVSKALVMSEGFPVIREEEVVLSDFPTGTSSAAPA